jgi:tRNA nucleotidyltransferase/poly(A) polymerase
MPDYIYLLENRFSHDQRHALQQLREAARDAGMILFLTGDAVRDLTSGHAVRSLEVTVHGNALKLKKNIEKLGGKVWGEHEPSQSLYLCFPGTVRVDLVSAHTVSYVKLGKPVFHSASIQEDLRRRDFTVNAMAISLNEGSFGLLMDPLNGAADIESRTLRLVSNYGFLEDPSLLIRAIRYRTRLGWEMDPRTRSRYEDAKAEGVIQFITPHACSQELEQIGHEDDGLAVLRALEAEGWMKVLFSAWTSAKADEEKLRNLHDLAVELLLQGVHADMSAAQMQLLTAKMQQKDLAALKKVLLRPGFVAEWNGLDAMASAFQKVLLSKENSSASATYKLFTSHDPEAVLWLGFTSKSATVQERYNLFLKVWPEVNQRIPYALLQEMRITPDLPKYAEIVQSVFLELIDGRLGTSEEVRSFLEPYSPPAPPPQVTIKRTRVKRNAEAKLKEQAFDEEQSEEEPGDDDLDDLGGDDEELELGLKLSSEDEADSADEEEPEVDEDEDSVFPPKAVPATKHPAKAASKPQEKPVKSKKAAGDSEKAAAKVGAKQAKPKAPQAAKTQTSKAATHASNKSAVEAGSAGPKSTSSVKGKVVSKAVPAKASAAKAGVNKAVKPKLKVVAKAVPAAKHAKEVKSKPAPSRPAKPAAKKVPAKPTRKR